MQGLADHPGWTARGIKPSTLLALLLSGLSVLVLVGWFTGYRELANWGSPPTTKPLIAACLLALAQVQLLSQKLPRPAIVATSAFVAAIGLTVLFQYWTGTDIALLDFMAPSGALPDPGSSHFRMTVSSATCLLLAGVVTALGPGPISTAARFAAGAIIVMIVFLAAGALSPEVRWPPAPTFFGMLLLAAILISGSLERGHPLSVNAALSLMLACAFIPALLLAWVQARDITKDRDALFVSQGRENAERAASLLDRFFADRVALLKSLAASPELQSQDLSNFFKHADGLAALYGSEIVLIDKSTGRLLSAAGHSGAALPPLTDMGAAISLFDEPAGYGSDLYIAPSSGMPTIAVFVPVPGQSFILRLASTSAGLSKQLQFAAPPGWTLSILDRKGTIAARSKNAEQSVGNTVPGPLWHRLNSIAPGHIYGESLDEGEELTYVQRKPLGWVTLAAVDSTGITEQIRSPMASLAVATAAMAGLALLFVWMGNKVLVVPLKKLAAAVREGRGKDFPTLHSSLIQEINEFSDAFHDAARARRAQEEALLERRKIEALGRLTYGVAHDFNNIISIVNTNLELIQLRSEDSNISRYVGEAAQATNMGARLNQRLMTFAQRRDLVSEAIDLNEFVRSSLGLINSAVGSSVAVEASLATSSATIFVDVSGLENSIINLAINSRDAMPRGGRLTISTSNVFVDEVTGKERGIPSGDYVQLSLADTGTGMPDEVRSRAFEPFYTTKVGQVSGLGLATVHGFVKQSGGDIKIESVVGAGTAVTILLPVAVSAISSDYGRIDN